MHPENIYVPYRTYNIYSNFLLIILFIFKHTDSRKQVSGHEYLYWQTVFISIWTDWAFIFVVVFFFKWSQLYTKTFFKKKGKDVLHSYFCFMFIYIYIVLSSTISLSAGTVVNIYPYLFRIVDTVDTYIFIYHLDIHSYCWCRTLIHFNFLGFFFVLPIHSHTETFKNEKSQL